MPGLLSSWSQLSFSAPSTESMLAIVTTSSFNTFDAFCKKNNHFSNYCLIKIHTYAHLHKQTRTKLTINQL